MHTTRRLVELLLYGMGDQRRYVQDSAIFIDVWIELIESDGKPIPLLLQPYLQLPPPRLARELVDAGITRERNALVYNNTLVSLSADLADVAFRLAPMTGWFRRASRGAQRERAVYLDPRRILQLDSASLWADVPLSEDARRYGDAYRDTPVKELLSFARVAGVAAFLHAAGGDRGRNAIERAARLLDDVVRVPPDRAYALLAELAADGWRRLLADEAAVDWHPFDTDWIYSITCDRPALLAVADSRKTIKADAATRVFDISCSHVTWAVIDSGIDATHPAFRRAGRTDEPSADASDGERSRVVRTFDFSWLRELLLGASLKALPERYHRQPDRLKQVRERAESFQAIDWGLLAPLLEILRDDYAIPVNRHGTHVAGILGADWPDAPRGAMRGICPDIELIDVRICKDDGRSDEFVVTAALQFLRYLNAHADMMVVHGINMSLSFEHDVASYACGRTPVCLEAERTVNAGVVVVAAAGNRGYRHIKAADDTTFYQFCAVSITDPGNAEGVITVGATHRREPHNFGVSYFSSRGPTGDGRIKPDLVAPGEKIYAPAPHGDAVTLDGTSMAAPHVSGAAALLLARNAELIGQPERIKTILCNTATDLGRERYFQGHGLVDALRALQSV